MGTGDSGGKLCVWGKGGNHIARVEPGAHDGSVLGLWALLDGTLVSGGGRDQCVVFWGPDYSKLPEVEPPKDFGPVCSGRGPGRPAVCEAQP